MIVGGIENMELSKVSSAKNDLTWKKSSNKSKVGYGLGVAVPTMIGAAYGVGKVVNGNIIISGRGYTAVGMFKGFKSVLEPYASKTLKMINKLPYGKKVTNFLRNSKLDLKPIKGTGLVYDKALMLKGAGMMAALSLATCACVYGAKKIFGGNKSK